MAKEKLPIKSLGYGKCAHCGHQVTVKRNSGAHLYAYCAPPADGGCGSGSTSRTAKGDEIFAKSILKWNDPKERANYVGGAIPGAAKAADPEPDAAEVEAEAAEPAPEPAAAPAPEKKTSWLDKEIF